MAMTHREALEVVARHRGERVVITTMTSVGVWPALSDTPLDFAYIPSAMGHGAGAGAGPGAGAAGAAASSCSTATAAR